MNFFSCKQNNIRIVIAKKEEVMNAVSKLPKKQRLVVMIRISEMLPFKDIGNILHMSEGTAKVNFHHGIKRIKTLLGIVE